MAVQESAAARGGRGRFVGQQGLMFAYGVEVRQRAARDAAGFVEAAAALAQQQRWSRARNFIGSRTR